VPVAAAAEVVVVKVVEVTITITTQAVSGRPVTGGLWVQVLLQLGQMQEEGEEEEKAGEGISIVALPVQAPTITKEERLMPHVEKAMAAAVQRILNLIGIPEIVKVISAAAAVAAAAIMATRVVVAAAVIAVIAVAEVVVKTTISAEYCLCSLLDLVA
jgi:hypothetical protein